MPQSCDGAILVLDEPTAALDARAESEVFRRFGELANGRTAVLISHRFSTVRIADRIIVLADGQVVESGSHEELVAQRGRYACLSPLKLGHYCGSMREGMGWPGSDIRMRIV